MLGVDELLVKVYATTVNRTDCALVTGRPWIMRLFIGLWKPKLPILGTDFAGEVIEVGANTSKFRVGDRVMGFRDEGLSSQAEFLTISEQQALAVIPEGIEFMEAAACLEAPHYAYNWIKGRSFSANHRVLVNGGTGAIGTALIQFMKKYGVEVTAVANTKNIDLMKKLGADKVFNYESEDFTNCTLRYDYIFDAVGKSTFGKTKHLLKEHGCYISSEFGPYGQNPILAIWTARSRQRKVVFPLPNDIQASVSFMADLLARREYKPVIERVYPLADIAVAYEYVHSGEKTGNVLLAIC